MREELIRLFKAVEIKSKRKKKADKSILNETIKYGFLFSPEVVYNYSNRELLNIIKIVIEELSLSSKQMNSSFHKSWKKVRDASIEQLVIEQIVHYITTYGFEFFGIYDEESVFIPNEKLDLPEIGIDGFNFLIIKGYKKDEIKAKVFDILRSGIALGTESVKDIVEIVKNLDITNDEVNEIKNKEVRTALYDRLNLFPKNPTEFLRYIIYKATGRTLLIKDNATIESLKEADVKSAILFKEYKKLYGLERLAEIFYRFKPLFLALKIQEEMRPIINRIRKLATEHHRPMKEDFLNTITAKIKNGERINLKEWNKNIESANIFRKIRLAYALKYRTNSVESILYRIRNGSAFAEEFDFENKREAKKLLDKVLGSIVKDIENNINGKKIYIPNYIKYALPATEKQFTGYFPSGTCIKIPSDMVFGIYWDNVDGNRIDLDLSLIAKDKKYGWDSSYRSHDRSILFSGDMTDASNGASELFYVQRNLKQESIMVVNYFNYKQSVEVPFKILVAKERVRDLKQNYMVDPNNVKAVANSKMDKKQKILGLLITTTNNCRFYFCESNIGGIISSRNNEYVNNSRKYLINFFTNTIDFNNILTKAGGIIIDEKDGCDIDLSPENLEKDTFIKLLI